MSAKSTLSAPHLERLAFLLRALAALLGGIAGTGAYARGAGAGASALTFLLVSLAGYTAGEVLIARSRRRWEQAARRRPAVLPRRRRTARPVRRRTLLRDDPGGED